MLLQLRFEDHKIAANLQLLVRQVLEHRDTQPKGKQDFGVCEWMDACRCPLESYAEVCVCACVRAYIFCAGLSSQFTLVLLSPVTPTHPCSYLHPEDCPLFNIWAWFHVVNEGCNAIIARPKSHADWNHMHIASYNPSRPAIYLFQLSVVTAFVSLLVARP